MKKGNPQFDYATGSIPLRKNVPSIEFNTKIDLAIAHTSLNHEIHLASLEETDAYTKKPPVRSDAKELHEDLILSQFPDDPVPMPSEALMSLLYEFSAVKAKELPHALYSLHPSALLALGISANEFMKHHMMPLVMEHVNRVLDEEEKEGLEDPNHYNDPDALYASVFDETHDIGDTDAEQVDDIMANEQGD